MVMLTFEGSGLASQENERFPHRLPPSGQWMMIMITMIIIMIMISIIVVVAILVVVVVILMSRAQLGLGQMQIVCFLSISKVGHQTVN